MIWEEWIYSEYNTAPAGGGWGNWFRYGNEVHYGPWLICENDISDGNCYGNEHEAPVLVSQTIIPNHNYGIYYFD